MIVPVILYDIDNNPIPINCISKTNTLFIRSFQNFGIEITNNFNSDTNPTVYSAKQNPNATNENDIALITNAYRFEYTENFAYTIFIESNIQILVWNKSGESQIYNIEYRPENIEPDHYKDLLINNNLPSYEELLPCIIDGNTAELIKRLLLDFKSIINHKGKITGIIKFLNLIGFDPESIKVYPEFITPNGDKTINPNTVTDYKSGDYHVIFNNYTIDADDKWTLKNMPKALLSITNLDEFFDKLYNALTLANIYFTLPEQDISFFGINYMANSEQYLSVAGNTYVTHYQNPHYYINNLKINLFSHYTDNLKKHLIIDNRQVNDVTEKTEVKYTRILPITNTELYLIDDEIFDNNILDLDFDVKSVFGNLLHLTVLSPNTYVKYNIKSISNQLLQLSTNNQLLGEQPLYIKYIATNSGQYQLTITVTDLWNNQEVYTYLYTIDANNALIDFVVLNSSELLDDELQNQLNLDISSPSITTIIQNTSDNYILPQEFVPELLNQYFDVDTSSIETLKFLSNKRKYITPEINKNFIVDDATDIIVDYMDNWLHVLAVQVIPEYKLKLRIVEPYYLKTELIPITDLGASTAEIEFINELFVTDLIILEQLQGGGEIENNYLLISTQSGGIELIPEMFDLVYHNETTDDIFSIWDITEQNFDNIIGFELSTEPLTDTKIPVNYDFKLFHRELSENNFPIIDDENPPIVKSIFPRLTDINYNVKLGDIIGCVVNKNYISNQKNIKWEVRNTFNNELLFETTDYMLKYRVSDKLIYTIILMFGVNLGNNDNYSVVKKSVVSSFQ